MRTAMTRAFRGRNPAVQRPSNDSHLSLARKRAALTTREPECPPATAQRSAINDESHKVLAARAAPPVRESASRTPSFLAKTRGDGGDAACEGSINGDVILGRLVARSRPNVERDPLRTPAS